MCSLNDSTEHCFPCISIGTLWTKVLTSQICGRNIKIPLLLKGLFECSTPENSDYAPLILSDRVCAFLMAAYFALLYPLKSLISVSHHNKQCQS